jgi:hypothetical protein
MKTSTRIKIKHARVLALLFVVFLLSVKMITGQNRSFNLYPYLYDSLPEILSPNILQDSIETILVKTKKNQYGIVDVTMENGKPLLYSYKLGTFMGKDNQTFVGPDFPVLVKTGLHDIEHLDKKEMITGIPIDIINCTAKPKGYSYSGFIADDEDIISVLKGDNNLVRAMGLTHPELAKPLFHIWNLILKEIELKKWPGRYYDNITNIYYNGEFLNFKVGGSKGWQISIFFDEIQGRYDIHIERKLTPNEEEYLKNHYSELNKVQFETLKQKLTKLDFSEMLPYYIMRYGFYEGHVDYRCDPIAIAFIFGLKDIEEIDKAFEGELFTTLTTQFTK